MRMGFAYARSLPNAGHFYVKEVIAARKSCASPLKVLLPRNSKFTFQVTLGLRLAGHRVDAADFEETELDDYDLIVPFTLGDIEQLQTRREELNGSILPIPSCNAVSLCNDKKLLNEFLIESGYRDYIPKMGDLPLGPCVIKKRVSAYSQGVYLIDSFEDENQCKQLNNQRDYFKQSFVPGDKEYALHAVVKDRRIIACLNVEHQYKSDLPIKGRTPLYHGLIKPCASLALFEAMLNDIGFEGLCCINYKPSNGNPMLLEINPRFGGSLKKFFFSLVSQMQQARTLVSDQLDTSTILTSK